jgi:FkbM family methyltransferase
MKTDTFSILFFNEILRSLGNNYRDNFDEDRFGKVRKFIREIQQWLIDKLHLESLVRLDVKHIAALCSIDPLYYLLNDVNSKELLVKILAYRALGYKKVKLPLNTPAFWQSLKLAKSLVSDVNDYIQLDFKSWRLHKTKLERIGFPIELYAHPLGTLAEFILKQYEYTKINGEKIKAEKGDIVIDAGGCYGDTALYFAHEVGKDGQVFSFEFMPDNLEIFEKNMLLNKNLADKINLIEKPLWSESNKSAYYVKYGPGTCITFAPTKRATGKVATITLDDFIDNMKIPKVNFIKMDIEGAEKCSLEGATETIKKFKPKLAIALYHKLSDFLQIPNFLDSLNLGYKFYLGHYTIHAEETVLFAETEE